jgi:arylsulfatase A-like enzyme
MQAVHLQRLAVGALLAAAQIALALARSYDLFLSPRELLEFVLATGLGICACVLGLGLLLDRATSTASARRTGFALVYALSATALGAWAGTLLTEGRRVRELSLRPVLVLAFALALGAALGLWLWAVPRIGQASPRLQRAFAASSGAMALACLAADALILPRGYPAFHALLFGLALCACALSVIPRAASDASLSRPTPTRWGWALLLLLPAAPLSLWHLAGQPNASYATLESAPFTAKLLRPFLRPAALPAAPLASAASEHEVSPVTRRVDLRDRDVLLITVDALRADLLRAWGGSGLTPELDKLASESLRFRRAYTPAPHTSYALASLLTAKFIKPVTELGSAHNHATLPDLLRRYGYRTAAFYPPAVFFVDGARFQALAERGFGFEYRKEMFASAEQRVTQLSSYLEQAEKRPLFVWMHLFEPHEPYEPPAELVRVDSARGRYEGEVRACDRAIAQLVKVFRAARPGATVIVSADHGEEFGDHGGSYHGSTLFEEQVHVPLLWSSPGAVQPGDSDAPVELVDVGATILSTAGIPRDARMRGDDLSGVLAQAHPGPKLAFASVEERHMVSDGRYKAICSASELHCQLFDLERDPHERKNLAGQDPERVERLRGELFAFLGSIAKREVVGVEQGVAFPEALVRARLSAPGAGPDVIPLLQDGRAVVRAASARVLGELEIAAALPALEALRARDPEPSVRDEAAVASLLLGSSAAHAAGVELLSRSEVTGEGLSLRRRAALALAPRKEARAVPVLAELLADHAQQESERMRAVLALAHIAHEDGVPALIGALGDVRLCEAAARALGLIGGKQAQAALLMQLAGERYEPARAAEAEALVKLGDRRVIPELVRFLGMETSLPGGVQLLEQLGALQQAGARGGIRLEANTRRGSWQCSERGCVPGADARILLPALAAPARISWSIDADPNATLQIGAQSFLCAGGPQQVSLPLTRGQRELSVQSQGRVELGSWVVVPISAEIPPPEPEPWDGGVEAPVESGNTD